MKTPLFTGACTALVTPFLDGNVNYPMLERLLQRQMDAGIRNFVICGTTGEAPTLSRDEKLSLFRRAKDFVGKDGKIIAGTGCNCTDQAVSLSIKAEETGADGLLVVSPYYNKGTEEGLYLHFKAIAESVYIPVILYNVPSRTGLDMPISVYRRLVEIPNILGVKEATQDIRKILQIRRECPADFTVWSGNDDMVVPMMALGAKGVISVVSNVAPVETQAMTQSALAGDFDTAAALQISLYPLIRLLFSEVSPVPVKAAMKLLGFDCGECRLPLGSMTGENYRKLADYLKN